MLKDETPKEVQTRLAAANKYESVGYRFYDGLLNVKNGWGWGCIDADGNQVIPCKYRDSILFDDNGYARVNTGRHQYGLIDRKGVEWIPCQYDNASGFDDDGFARYEKGIYWGTIDEEGNNRILPKMKFQQIGSFQGGVAMAKIDTKWGLIDPDGNHLTEFKYYEISPLADGLYRVRIKPKLYNFLKPDGSHLFEKDFSFIKEFDEDGFAEFYMEPSKKEKETNPDLHTKHGVAHISGIILHPAIYDHLHKFEEPQMNHLYYAQVGTQGYYLAQNGRVVDANALAENSLEREREAFFRRMSERFTMSKRLVEDVLNWTMPGLQLFYRDMTTDADVRDLYKVGDIFRAGDYVNVTPILYKPVGNVRYLIASAHTAAWYEHPGNVSQDPDVVRMRRHIIHRNSYFKVMDVYTVGDVTQVFLLHIPYRGIGLFLGDTLMNFVTDGNGTSLVDIARSSLDNKMQMEPHELSLDPKWTRMTDGLVGLDSRHMYYEIEYDTRKFYSPGLDDAVHRMSGDNEEINLPE